MGAPVTANYPAGGFIGGLLRSLVDREGVASVVVKTRGETRENFHVFDRATGQQLRFVVPGPRLGEKEWRACLDALAAIPAAPAFICASGSLPPGVPDDFYARVADLAAQRGARFVLDTSGAPLKAALGKGAFLWKPSIDELRGLTGRVLTERADMIAACRELITGHSAEVVALTLGAQGALLVTRSCARFAPPLAVRPLSTVGAGDSFLGVLLWALGEGMAIEEAFRWGVAGGTAALLAPGTELCRADDVRRLEPQVKIEDVETVQAPSSSSGHPESSARI
jgi:6-phosphofructokinase 2